jgi:hypothetical protein
MICMGTQQPTTKYRVQTYRDVLPCTLSSCYVAQELQPNSQRLQYPPYKGGGTLGHGIVLVLAEVDEEMAMVGQRTGPVAIQRSMA